MALFGKVDIHVNRVDKVNVENATIYFPPQPPDVIIIRIIFDPPASKDPGGSTVSRRTQAMPGEVQLQDDQQVHFGVTAVSKEGNPATIDGPISLASDDEAIATVEVDADGLGGTIRATGPAGVVGIHITADARLGDEVLTIEDNIAVNVVAGEAAGFGITFGEPEENPDTP